MKKIIFISVIILITLTACDLNNNPNSKVEELLGKYQMFDKTINITTSRISGSTNLDNDTEEKYKDIIKKQYKNLSYELKEEKIDGDTATVTAEIEVLDYKSVLDKYQKENYNETDYHDKVTKGLKEVKEKTVYTVEFTLAKDKNGNWSVDPLTDEIESKLLGIY